MAVRQPIVSVLGHVDHGKTTFLDYIRGTSVVDREAGKITQHIGATEIPLDTISKICGNLVDTTKFSIPGLLFIDTPGHQSFTTLRTRGGALADLAVLIVDITEGMKPQTIESINILKRFKTPFIVGANKVDRIHGWRDHKNQCFMDSFQEQNERVQNKLDELLYDFIGVLYKKGLPADRYDRVKDFTKNIGIVPMSAKTGEGVADMLMLLVGLAQRFLEKKIEMEEGPGEGTVLEVKEEKGLGTTIDAIIYKGTIRKGDTIVIGSEQPIVSKVRAILKPKPNDEIRDPRERFDNVKEVSAAAGVKLAAPDLDGVVGGAPIRVANVDLDIIIEEMAKEARAEIDLEDDGITIKADAIGSLEALAYELKAKKINIYKAEVGNISRRDIIDISTASNLLDRIILGFNVGLLPDAEEEMHAQGAKVVMSDIVYKLVDDYVEWLEKTKFEMEKSDRVEITYPGKFKLLPDCVFRVSKPAVCGVRVIAGRVRPGQRILRSDGRVVGRIKSIQSEGKTVEEAITGQEIAVSIEGITIGRQLCVEDVAYVDIPEADAKTLQDKGLSVDERQILEEVFKIKRKEDKFWGM